MPIWYMSIEFSRVSEPSTAGLPYSKAEINIIWGRHETCSNFYFKGQIITQIPTDSLYALEAVPL